MVGLRWKKKLRLYLVVQSKEGERDVLSPGSCDLCHGPYKTHTWGPHSEVILPNFVLFLTYVLCHTFTQE